MVTNRTSRTRREREITPFSRSRRSRSPPPHDEPGIVDASVLMPSIVLNEDLGDSTKEIGVNSSGKGIELKAALIDINSRKSAVPTTNVPKKRSQTKQFVQKTIKLIEMPVEMEEEKEAPQHGRTPD